jgi:hypothetical protein
VYDADFSGQTDGMPEPQARAALHTLSATALGRIRASGQPIESFRGIAIYDTSKDEIFTSLDGFDEAEQELAAIPSLQERYGVDQASRLALQFIYELLGRLQEPVFDEELFESLWANFLAELAEPQWLFRGVANARFLAAEGPSFDLGDGVSIKWRSAEELSPLGFSDAALAGLFDDWAGFGASSYIMLVEDRLDKAPDNFILSSSSSLFGKAQRSLCALRLLAPGDIGIGRMWVGRPMRFNVGLGGTHMVGHSVPAFGSEFQLTESIAAAVPAMYDALRRLETQGYGAAPGNLDLALRSFRATYDRPAAESDSRVLDAITALEAVLASSEGEITFKLSFRVAGILAAGDAERVHIFNEMKAYYDLRSKLVHGSSLKEKHHRLIADVEPLRHHVRELLRGLIHMALTPGDPPYSKQFFTEHLDAALLDRPERDRLRSKLGMCERGD